MTAQGTTPSPKLIYILPCREICCCLVLFTALLTLKTCSDSVLLQIKLNKNMYILPSSQFHFLRTTLHFTLLSCRGRQKIRYITYVLSHCIVVRLILSGCIIRFSVVSTCVDQPSHCRNTECHTHSSGHL